VSFNVIIFFLFKYSLYFLITPHIVYILIKMEFSGFLLSLSLSLYIYIYIYIYIMNAEAFV